MKDAIKKTYGTKGDKVVQMNYDAVDGAVDALNKIEVPESWSVVGQEAYMDGDEPEFVKNVIRPMMVQQGDKLPVSAFSPDGIFPTGTTKYEKRGVGIMAPEWIAVKLYSVQPLFLCLPPCGDPPGFGPGGRSQGRAQGFCNGRGQGEGFERARAQIQYSSQPPRLRGLRQLRGHLSLQKEEPGHETPGNTGGSTGPQS